MSEKFCRFALVSLLLVLLIVPPQAGAWGNVGHEAIAYVAWQQMTPATKARVLSLLPQVIAIQTKTALIPGFSQWMTQLPPGLSAAKRDQFLFMRAATWADSIKHAGLIDSDTPPAGVNAGNEVNIGFSDQHSHGYWHFIDTAFASDSETVPATPAPNAATQIVALRADIASTEADPLKAYDLVWLLHLVGDIHQPLHASDRFNAGKDDSGGLSVKITLPTAMKQKFKCPPSTFTPSELHAFWDDLPGSCPAATGLTVAVSFAKSLPLFLSGPSLKGAGRVTDVNPADWAKDSFALAQKDSYGPPIGPGLTPVGSTTGYVITQVYYNQALADAQDSLALAGARLAKLLNENLK